jgi:hypothetical protein
MAGVALHAELRIMEKRVEARPGAFAQRDLPLEPAYGARFERKNPDTI